MTQKRHDTAPNEPDSDGGAGDLTDAEVVRYLRRHPDFLARHTELLEVMEAPGRQDGDGVIDLQQFMLDRLRGEVARIRESRDDLIQTGRTNQASMTRVHAATLSILAARSFEHVIETVTTDLAVILDLDAVTICVEGTEERPPPCRIRGVLQMEPGTVQALLGRGRSHAFLPDIHGEPELFGSAAGLVRSAALLRLEISSATPPALLALGTRTPQHFDPSQGSELLLFLARALELTIRQWLELPE